MKLYCFLLLIILIFLVYDNKLYEGNDQTYDTTQDKYKAYKTGGPSSTDTEKTVFDKIGIGDILPTELIPDEYKTIGNNTVGLQCDKYKNITCNQAGGKGIKDHDPHWPYGSKNTNNQKTECMNCLKCIDNAAFPTAFYANMCDTMAGCYDNPTEYYGDTLPYVYSYFNTKWNDACNNPASLNQLQKITCKIFNDNSLIDTMLLIKRPESAVCHAEIAALQTPGVGAVANLLL
jgi:hypothetical protein